MSQKYVVRLDIYQWDDEDTDTSEEFVESVASAEFDDPVEAYAFANHVDFGYEFMGGSLG